MTLLSLTTVSFSVFDPFCPPCLLTFDPLFPHRPLAYSTLADLVHHVRQNLPLTDLSLAVQLFAKNIEIGCPLDQINAFVYLVMVRLYCSLFRKDICAWRKVPRFYYICGCFR